MASYWKSPYKERSNSGALHATFTDHQKGSDPFVPISLRPYCGLNKVKHAGPMSPQEWFDWAFTVNSSNLRPVVSNLRHTKAEIKGILKIPADEVANEDEKTGNDTESNESSRSELGCPRREKKRVTFDESTAVDASSGLRFQPSPLAVSLTSKIKAANPLNGFPKKRSDHFSKLKKLPGVSGEVVISTHEEETEPNISNTICKHSPELRCANCVSSAETETNNIIFSTSQSNVKEHNNNILSQDSQVANRTTTAPECSTSWSKPVQGNAPSTKSLKLYSGNDKICELPREPLKKYKPQWAKTFSRLQKKRQHIIRLTSRRNNSIPNNIRTNDRFKSGAANSEAKGQLSEDFSKLHISGDGKLVRTKLESRDVNLATSHKSTENFRLPKSTPTSFTKHDNKTPSLGGSLSQSAPLPRGRSAPGRLREDTDNSQPDSCMDKTSQILSWLDDVRSKGHFKPRNNRTYATGPTYLR
ncbi:hypothetical protein RRG08_025015 [Elysia crispata]|uniref:Uncharacterized protein n=1 Tax=Elysia crispata TaxID=231223 RepID=A0AAE1E2H9_9GAST|nr:hypothetical protein RRG08_025015 [Elysia crispata]